MKKINIKTGVLGGGQLGKMLALDAARWDLPFYALDKKGAPAADYCTGFFEGDFRNVDDVLAFGKQMELLTIEIEGVNGEALAQLQKNGLPVYPEPGALDIIRDKGRQKMFYKAHQLPTGEFQLFDNPEHIVEAVRSGELALPLVQKLRTEGYDGRGVKVIRTDEDLESLMEGKSIVEKFIEFEKELAVMVARNRRGEIRTFPPVEMVFHPEANLVEQLICPARIEKSVVKELDQIARDCILAYSMHGSLAIEFFLDKNGNLLINEVAPRPHNSGHHTIEACATSQFEQHLRAILDLPLGDTRLFTPAVMVNIVGEEGHEGPAKYDGLEQILKQGGVHLHLYGKSETRPFRKMGHVTVTDPDLERAIEKANFVQDTLKVIT